MVERLFGLGAALLTAAILALIDLISDKMKKG
jgi:hypothetical protein